MPIILLISLICFSAFPKVPSLVCKKNGSMRYLRQKKYYSLIESFCVDSSFYRLVSEACLTSKKCEAVKRYTNKFISTEPFSGGKNPEFIRCQFLGGEIQQVEFFHASKWNPEVICRFPDKSFISVNNLLRTSTSPSP